jgi:hypothetical protein
MEGYASTRRDLEQSFAVAQSEVDMQPVRCGVTFLCLLVSLITALRLADGQIVGGFNVGFNPRAAMNLRNSHVSTTGIGQQHAWFGSGTTYNPFGTYTPPVKPFSYPQFQSYNRPLVTSKDVARTEVLRGLGYGYY